VERCECLGATVSACLRSTLGNEGCVAHFQAEQDACSECACDPCPEQLLNCYDDGGCVAVLRCMHITGCSGDECGADDACGDVIAAWGGPEGASHRFAVELAQCQNDNQCSCASRNNPDTLTCGSRTCEAYTEGAAGPAVPACCFPFEGELYCGLDLNGVLYATCEPKGQTGTPDNACPDFVMPERFPYNGALLQGCCRPDNTCGYHDNITGLNCLPPAVVDGITTEGASCVYPG
jgi:hypothetical protein